MPDFAQGPGNKLFFEKLQLENTGDNDVFSSIEMQFSALALIGDIGEVTLKKAATLETIVSLDVSDVSESTAKVIFTRIEPLILRNSCQSLTIEESSLQYVDIDELMSKLLRKPKQYFAIEKKSSDTNENDSLLSFSLDLPIVEKCKGLPEIEMSYTSFDYFKKCLKLAAQTEAIKLITLPNLNVKQPVDQVEADVKGLMEETGLRYIRKGDTRIEIARK